MPSETFTNDGQEVTWTVPDGVTEITVEAWGAHGSNSGGSASGQTNDVNTTSGENGGKAEATFEVSPGATVSMDIGSAANGTNGGWPDGGDADSEQYDLGPEVIANGGGGGGSTAISVNGTLLLQAGGGGGGGAAVASHRYSGNSGEIGADAGGGGYANTQGGSGAYAEATDGIVTISASASGGDNGGNGYSGSGQDDFSNIAVVVSAGGGGGGYANGGGGGFGGTDTNVSDRGLIAGAAGGGGSGTAFIDSSGTNTSTANNVSSPNNGENGQVRITYTQPPDPPSDLAVTAGDRECSLTWANDPDGYDKVEVYRSLASGGETTADYTRVDTVDGTAESYTDATATTDGERFYYRLRGIFGGNSVGWSNEDFGATNLPAPTNLAHPTTGDESAAYEWIANHNNGGTRVEYRRANEGDDWTTDETVASDVESATVDGLLNGEQYESRVVAQTEHAETEDK